MNDRFVPVDVGDKGRRARAWLTRHSLVVEATDANVAGHAMAEVLEAIKATGGREDSRRLKWAEQLLKEFPALPDTSYTATERSRGKVDVDVKRYGVGYGYVRPTAQGWEAGGALFYPEEKSVREIAPHPIWLTDQGRPQ